MNNVKDFGAKGDGFSNDTESIQKAIDAGGTAYIPSGTYVIGTLYLKDDGGLHLAPGAVLRASHRREDYNADDFCPQNVVFRQEMVTGAHMIVAVERKNIFIEGEGSIDGDAFFWRSKRCPRTNQYLPNPDRPGQMIFFCECTDVRVSGVHLRNGSYWHLFLHGCENVIIHALRITGEKWMATNDGIDVDCCRRVTISDCLIDTGDDAITLRGYEKPLKHKKPCEYICVTNCVLSSFNDNAIRIGVGEGVIRNCVFSNLVIAQSRTGICIISRFSSTSPGVSIENIQFSNLEIQAHRPINIKLKNREDQEDMREFRFIRKIRFSGIHAESDRNCNLFGAKNGLVEDIRFQDCDFLYGGNGIAPDTDERGLWGYASTDSVFTAKYVRDILFDHVRIAWKENTSGWHYDLFRECSEDIRVEHCSFKRGVFPEE